MMNKKIIMDTIILEEPSFETLQEIHNCLVQQANSTNAPKEFFIIQVWFPEAVRNTLKANVPDGQYHIRYKTEEKFGNQYLLEHSKKIWNNNLVPIELIQSYGGLFYALPRKAVLDKNFKHIFILSAEETIPTVEDFEDVTIND